ncbi:MAG: protease [Armatimonadetes bacterium]|nr:protease [Armatimonadota bacterium]GIK31762.1 MAG: tricorn protease [Armatimonadota bacterium]
MTALLLGACLASPVLAEEMRLMRFPDIHGDTVVFTYASDLWTAKREGGLARRITSHPGQETRARISPDGKFVAFSGEYDGNVDVFVVPIEGGEPKRLSYDPVSDLVLDWTPDGKIAYKSLSGTFNSKQPRMWVVDPKGGLPAASALQEVSDGTFSPDGKSMAFNRVSSHQFNWRRYRGGTQGRISLYEFATNKYSELPSKSENSWHPMWIGNAVYYASDRNQGTVNLYRYDLGNRQDRQLTTYADADIKWPASDGKSIVFERDGYLHVFDIATSKTEKLAPMVLSDFLNARPTVRSLGDQITSLSLSPSGVRVAVEARGEVFSVPKENGETRNMTHSTRYRERFPAWSPDGQNIAFVSDASGENEVYMQPQLGGESARLTTGFQGQITGIEWTPNSKKIAISTRSNELWLLDVESKGLRKVFRANYGLVGWDISPDSKWIAYVNQKPSQLGAIYLYNIESGQEHEVTDGRYDDASVTFDMNGKYLYLVSARTFGPTMGHFELAMAPMDVQRVYVVPLAKTTANPLLASVDEEPVKKPGAEGENQGGAGQQPASQDVKIDLDGLSDRVLPLPMPAGNYAGVIGLKNGLLYLAEGGLFKFSLDDRQSQQIAPMIPGQFSLNASRTKIAYFAGGTLGIADIRPGLQVGQGRVSTAGITAPWSPTDEWEQIFDEAWRYFRDNFYDPGLLGLDWKAVGDRYRGYLPYVRHRDDLNYILGLMIGELGTGHAYVGGGDMGAGSPGVPVGMLGCDYSIEGNHVRFKKIYPGANYEESFRSPLRDPGVNVQEGDYLLEIDGQPVDATVHPASLLIRKVGRSVVITVNSTPSLEGARKERVRPISTENQLRYWSWVEDARKYVQEKSGGKIGYMHIPDTQFSGTTEFMRGFWSQTDKEAWIVDERWNGGGFVQPWFVDTLARRIRAGIIARNTNEWTDAVAMEGPKAMLINQYAGSGGDFFPWMFRQARLGPLIGMRTWGGLVGISGSAPLVDGGFLTAPEFGLYDRETGKWIAENTGVAPDIEVDLKPDDVAAGRDPQLDRAIEYLLNELKKGKQGIKRPPFPAIKPGS